MLGITITIFTDHVSLTYFKSLKTMNNELQRWAIRLSEFEMKIVYKKEALRLTCFSRTNAKRSC